MGKPLLLFLLLLSACHSHRQSSSQKEEKGDRIAMLVMKMQKQEKGLSITLINKTESPGTLKPGQNNQHGSNYLQVSTWRNHVEVDSFAIEHPLYKHYEYIDGSGRFSVKDTVLSEAEFFFRVQLKGNNNEIRITEVLAGKPQKQITAFTL